MSKKKDNKPRKPKKAEKKKPGKKQPQKGQGKLGNKSQSPDLDIPPSTTMENMNWLIKNILDQQDFKDPDEMQDFIDRNLVGRDLDKFMAMRKMTPSERAQDFAYQAMDARTDDEAVMLIREALKFDAKCVDALHMQATFSVLSYSGFLRRLKKIVAIGKRKLGKAFFEENRGHFWGMIETRPYMRVRRALIELYVETGQHWEAIKHCEDMLVLNPGDNQGIRDILLALYLIEGDLESARELMDGYQDFDFAVFGWGRVLERFITGDLDDAYEAFKEAHRNNSYVRAFLTGKKKLPDEMPECYSIGSKEEAAICADLLILAWQIHPEAIEWLRTIKHRK